ncbi:MAG: hypothetical protein WC346_22115 [Methanogenium sp.]|jgi:hypothetical protein
MSLLTKYKDTKVEQAVVTSVDRLTGRVGIYLRNGLSSVATYLYNIEDLRVGLSVVVTKVDNHYVILNMLTSDAIRKSYSVPKTHVISETPKTCSGTIAEDVTSLIIGGTVDLSVKGQPNTIFKWSIEGGGSFTYVSNRKVTYQAPSDPEEVLIKLSLEDGTLCDSLDIVVYRPTCLATIGYTTQGMMVNESQNLTVINPDPGITYYWEVWGGGSLSDYYGNTTTYYAPATNPYCEDNAEIRLYNSFGSLCDTLKIAINNYVGGETAFLTVQNVCDQNVPAGQHYSELCCPSRVAEHNYDNGYCCSRQYNCKGILRFEGGWQTAGWGPWDDTWCDMVRTWTYSMCYGLAIGGTKIWTDIRSDIMKQQGCCPAELL